MISGRDFDAGLQWRHCLVIMASPPIARSSSLSLGTSGQPESIWAMTAGLRVEGVPISVSLRKLCLQQVTAHESLNSNDPQRLYCRCGYSARMHCLCWSRMLAPLETRPHISLSLRAAGARALSQSSSPIQDSEHGCAQASGSTCSQSRTWVVSASAARKARHTNGKQMAVLRAGGLASGYLYQFINRCNANQAVCQNNRLMRVLQWRTSSIQGLHRPAPPAANLVADPE